MARRKQAHIKVVTTAHGHTNHLAIYDTTLCGLQDDEFIEVYPTYNRLIGMTVPPKVTCANCKRGIKRIDEIASEVPTEGKVAA